VKSLISAVLQARENERERLLRSSPAEVAAVPDNWSPAHPNQNTKKQHLAHAAPSRATEDEPSVADAAWSQRPEWSG
jgi:hypothetical protein